MPFDLQLFQQLNEEYRDKPVHPRPRKADAGAVAAQGDTLAQYLSDLFGVKGKRCLEIGCGRGATARTLCEKHGATVVGVDVTRYETWDAPQPPGVELQKLDITCESFEHLGRFDFIYSNSVWEHIHHPKAALAAAKKLLAWNGDFFLSANLYRGPIASHRTGEVFFPWPHLLFSDEVFEQFYAQQEKNRGRSAWLNKLTAAEYLASFEELGFSPVLTWYSRTAFDEAFYKRFEDVLGRYPKRDLELDFIKVHLRHTSTLERVMRGISKVRIEHAPAHGLRWARKLRRALQGRRPKPVDPSRLKG